jgi:hypothetical protein
MVKFNRGDASEGVLGAAITARFISKTKAITEKDLKDVIAKFRSNAMKTGKTIGVNIEFDSPNKKATIKDKVKLTVSLAEVNMNAIISGNIYKDNDMKKYIDAAIGYANSIYVREWADMVYNNNQKNLIEISSEGLLDQSGTKVDLRIKIDGKQAGVGISLKVGDVKQFGQVGGADTETITTLFGPLGIVFSKSFLNNFEKFVADKKPTEALNSAYKEAERQLNSLNGNDMKENLAKFVKYHGTRNEDDVTMVVLGNKSAHIYDFDNIMSKLKGVPLKVEYSESATKVIPGKNIAGLDIYADDAKANNPVFISLRTKLEGNRISKGKKIGLTVRNYVEKGKLMTELLSTAV